MDILDRYYSLMLLLEAAERVSGRKKIQKMVYLLQQADCPFKERFDYHLYGPYSEELAVKLDEMKFMGLLEEKMTETPVGYRQYEYSLSETGKQYLKNRENEDNKSLDFPSHFRDMVQELNRFDARTLELMATLRFLKNVGYSDSEAEDLLAELKPEQNYKGKEIERALRFINTLM